VNRILSQHDTTLPARVVALLGHDSPPNFYHDLLSSQLDADRLDYLLRDNLMTGSRYGDYDLRWLLQAITIDTQSNRLAVEWKGVSAVEAYLQARYHMYRNVYFHKVVRSAEGMVKLALQRARRLAVQGRLNWPSREHCVCKTLLGQTLSNYEFVDLDDIAVLHCFKEWTRCEDAVLARLCSGLLYRRLYKTIDLSRVALPDAAQAVKRAFEAVRAAGGDPAYDMFFDEVADTPYKAYNPASGESGSEILVCEPNGTVIEFAAISPAAMSFSKQLIFRRIHVLADYRDAVAAAVASVD